ncbi:MAG: aromatic ring-hydroxylating dioxygenase subunit alpha [Candidatus Binataceae bacterium]|nr:aromatic ring-hydroxylating dioxygenase subunit alpha [Candidatus Binataceae bacterium]
MTEELNSNQRWARAYPELGTAPLAIEPCVSPEYFELEREHVFRRVWMNVGRVEEAPNAGDYFVRDMAVCRTSILVVRGKDGQLRGFHNMCSHRGNKLEWEKSGHCRGAFTCKFHGWAYDTQGRLMAVPDEENFFDLKTAENGLTPVALDTWQGFIFIHLDIQPKETLRQYLGEITEDLDDYPFDQLPTCFTYRADERVNWKILLDAQQEGYHVPILHKRTLGRAFLAAEGLSVFRSLSMKMYRRHHLLASTGTPGYQPSAAEGLAYRYGTSSLGSLVTLSTGKFRGMIGTFDFYVFFPNFVIATMPGTYFTYNLWPLAAERTLWEVRMYYPQAKNAAERFSQEFSKLALRDALMEDASTHENIQSMLSSGAKRHFILQDEEAGIRHLHKVVQEHIENGAAEH